MNHFFRQFWVAGLLSASTLVQRWRTGLVSIIGFAAVAAVLVAVLALATGMSVLLRGKGAADIAMITSKGAFAETASTLPRELEGMLVQAPGLRGGPAPSTSAEFLGTAELAKASTGEPASILVRGFQGAGGSPLRHVGLAAGRFYRPGVDEVVMGQRLVGVLSGISLGRAVLIGNRQFEIVGIFSSDGDIQESEVWGDAAQLSSALGAPGQVNVIYARLATAAQLPPFIDFLATTRGLGVSVEQQSAYYDRQASRYRELILIPGLAIVLTMGLAATLGSVNTMRSTIQSRIREIATLRAIGYGGGALTAALVAEAAVLGLAGGLLGAMLSASLLHGMSALTSNGINSMAFEFMPTREGIAATVLFAVAIGVLGGLWPAIAASRVEVAEALREA